MTNPLISVIIVNWNGEKVIKDCLSSLFAQKYKNIEVIVVDNNSHDSSRDIIRSFKKVLLIEHNVNSGFAEGNNIGFKTAKGEYILLLNSDVFVTENFLLLLLTSLQKNRKIGVVQPKVLYSGNALHNDKVINSIGAYYTNTGFLYYPGYGKVHNLPLYNKNKKIFTAYGACMLIRREVIDSVGLFDGDFFMYFEETDFCMRVWMGGWEVVYISDASIYHKGGVSARKYGTEKIYFHSFKNRINTYLKNLETKNLIKVLPFHISICVGISFIYLFQGKIQFFLAIHKAFLWNIQYLEKTRKKRHRIQKKRTIPDSYLSSVTGHPRASYYIYLLRGLEYYKD